MDINGSSTCLNEENLIHFSFISFTHLFCISQITHLVIGGISCLTEVIALIVLRDTAIFELAIPGLVSGMLVSLSEVLVFRSIGKGAGLLITVDGRLSRNTKAI